MLAIIICLLLTLGYVSLMTAYRTGWKRQKDFILPLTYEPSTFITVVIPARNESDKIGACIESVLAQKYPAELFEIIVVDDHSDDHTAEVVKEYANGNVRCISLEEHLESGKLVTAYKKAAIAAGIAVSNGTLIVTTDADCIAPNTWLKHIAGIYEQEKPVMVVSPVVYMTANTLLQIFQTIDFMSMQGITVAAHSMKLGNMSNGANLAFSKATYTEVSGYEGIEHLASGDDYLLMMKMRRNSPNGISYLKSVNAIVQTTPQPDWSSFLQQRIRWASKSGKYADVKLTRILVLVYLFNLSFLLLFLSGFAYPAMWVIALVMLAIKIVIEAIFLIPVARFFKKMWVLRYFPFLQPLHILYIILAGFLGFVGEYQWKGRKVR